MDCLVASVLRLHSELSKSLGPENATEASGDKDIAQLTLDSVLSSPHEVRGVLLQMPFLLEDEYIHRTRQALDSVSLKALLDCTPIEGWVWMAKQSTTVSCLTPIHMFTATLLNIHQCSDMLQLTFFSSSTKLLHINTDFRYMFLVFFNYMLSLLFFIKLDPNSHLATVCFGILRRSLCAVVSNQNVDALLPGDGQLIMDTINQVGLVKLALYSKGGIKFLFSLLPLLESAHQHNLIAQMTMDNQISPRFLFSRKLSLLSHLCKAAASKQHMYAAYLNPDDLIALQGEAITAIFTMLSGIEEYETFMWALQCSLPCLKKIIFTRVSPVHINKTSGSLRTMYRCTGFIFALEKLDALLSKDSTGIRELSLALSFYVDCIQRFTILRYNLILYKATLSKGGKLIMKNDINNSLLSDKLESMLINILEKYFAIVVSSGTLDSDFLVNALVGILRWAPVQTDAAFNLFINLIKTSIERHKTIVDGNTETEMDSGANFTLQLILIFYKVCLSIGVPTESPWLDQAEARCIKMIVHVALPFVYEECVPFLQILHAQLPTEDSPVFQEAILGVLKISQTVFRSITRQLLYSPITDSSLRLVCKALYSEHYTTIAETASAATDKFVNNFLSVTWVCKEYSPLLQHQLFKSLCDTLISFVEFAYVPTLRIKVSLFGNIFLTVYTRATRVAMSYGKSCLEIILLCMLFQYITLGHFTNKEHQLVAFWMASTSLDIIDMLQNLFTSASDKSWDLNTPASLQNLSIIMLMLIGEILKIYALLEEVAHEHHHERYVRRYEYDLRMLLRQVMTSVLGDKGARLDFIHQCLVFLCSSSVSCYILPSSLFCGVPLFLPIAFNKCSQGEIFKFIEQSSHSCQARKWHKLMSRDRPVFQSVSYELMLQDSGEVHDRISVSVLFLSTTSHTLWKVSPCRSLRFMAESLDYLYSLSTEAKAQFSRTSLNTFVRSCIISGEPHTLRTIADFIVKANILPAFFSTADEDSPLDIHLLSLLMKQSDSLIIHSAIVRYLLKQLGGELPHSYLLAERHEFPADEGGMLRFLSYFSVLFQTQLYPLLEQSLDQSVPTLQTEIIVPGNSLLLYSCSSPLRRARRTIPLSSLNTTVFTYCHISNSFTMTLTLTASGRTGDRPQHDVTTLTIWIHDGSVFFSTNANTASNKYNVPLDKQTEWIYIEATFSSENLVIVCHTTLSGPKAPVASIPLDIDSTKPFGEAQLDIDAVIRIMYLSEDAFNAVNSVTSTCTVRIYPIAIYSQSQNDQQHFLRSQAPTFTWAYAETIGYSFVMYDDSEESGVVRAIMPQDVWSYDIGGLFQTLSLLFLGESSCNGRTPRYKQEFEPALLLKLLHMLQDSSMEEIFSHNCGYKLLIAYFATLQWPVRMQALHVVVVFTRFLFEHILKSDQESSPHLLLLLTKLYHELIIVPATLYFPDEWPAKEPIEEQSKQWTTAEQCFYTWICQLHQQVFSKGYYMLCNVSERTSPVGFILYQLFIFCHSLDEITKSLNSDSSDMPLEKFTRLLRNYAKDNDMCTSMLIHLLKCMSLPSPITNLSPNNELVALIYELYTNALNEEAYAIIKAVPVVADLYLYEKILLLPITLSIDDITVSSTLTRLMWKEWAPGQSAFHELFADIKLLLERKDFPLLEEADLKTSTTLCGVADFFIFVLFNLFVKGRYDRFEKTLVTYAVLPLVMDKSTSTYDPLLSLKYVLDFPSESLYAEYLPVTVGLISLVALALFIHIGADVLGISNLDEENRDYSTLDNSLLLLIKVFNMLLILVEKAIDKTYIVITISAISSMCTFSKKDMSQSEILQQLIDRLSDVSSLANILQPPPLSSICAYLNTYSKAAAEQLHKKLDVLRTSASIDVLPFSANGNSALWSPYLPTELHFCPIGNLFANVPAMKNANLEGDMSEHYVCPGCMSSISLQGPSLEMTQLVCGNVCIICSYTPKYKSFKVYNATSANALGVFPSIVHLEMMNVSTNTRFSLSKQRRADSRHNRSDPKVKPDQRPNQSSEASNALNLFYQRYLYFREVVVAHFILPHPIYRPMHNLSSQRIVLLSPSTFSYPSVRLNPTFIQSDINGRLQDSCLTDIGGALPPLNATSLRQYSITNTNTNRRLIEFGDVLVVSLLYTGYGVLSLRVSSDFTDKTEKQAPPMGEQIVIMDKYREKMCFSIVDTEPSFVACTGNQTQTFLFSWARFDQRSESEEDSAGSFQAPDETTNTAIKEHQEAESFSILRRLLCTKDNPRSVHLENSFSKKQDSFGRRISYGLYDYFMSNKNKTYCKYKDVELSIEFSRILYMIPFFFIRTQPALQIIDSSGTVYVLLFKTQEHAVKLIHSYGYYRRFGCGDFGCGSAYGTYYYYARSPYKKKGALLDFETIVSTFQTEIIAQLRTLFSRRVSLLTASNTISMTTTQFSVFTLLSAINMVAARSPVVSYIYSIFPALSPHNSSKTRNLRYPIPAQSSTSLCKSIVKYAEMSLGELQNTSPQDRAAVTAFLNDILSQSSQMLEKVTVISSDDVIASFRKSLEKANLSPSAVKFLSGSPLFRTFVSNNMSLPYYCFSVEPFTSLQRSLQGGCLDAFSRLFIGLRSHWEKVELGSTFHEAIPELFYTPYIFTNTNGLQLSSDAEAISEALQSAPSQAIDTVYAQRTALESTIFVNQPGQASIRSWLELLFGSRQQSLDALNLFPNGTAECYPGEANIATSLYFGTYPIRLNQDEFSKLLSLIETVHVHRPAKMADELGLTHSAEINKHLHVVPFEQLTLSSVQNLSGEYELVFRRVNQPALCVAGRHISQSNHINGMLWTTKDCIVIDTYMLYFDVNRQEISIFELSKAFIDNFHGASKGGSGGTSSILAIGNSGRDQESGGINAPDQLLTGAQHQHPGNIVILGFVRVSGSRPCLLTNIPVTQLAKQGKAVGTYVTTFKLASSLSRRYPTSKNIVISKIDSVGYMPFYEHVIHLYTNYSIILANIRNLSAAAQPQLFIIQHCPLDVGYYGRLTLSNIIHVPELSLICYYSPHVLHVLEYNLLHRTVSYGTREAESPYLLTKFRISYEEKLEITHCAVHERQGLIAVGLSILNREVTVDSNDALRYCIYLYTLGNIHVKVLDVPTPVQHIVFFGGYDDGFAGYILVNKRYVYSLDSDTSQNIRKICETEILADSLAVMDGAIVGYQDGTFRWYS